MRHVLPGGPGTATKGPPARALKPAPPLARPPDAARPEPAERAPRSAGASPRAAPVPRSFQVADAATAALLLALAALVLGASLRMGIGWGSDGPQGGFVPFWLAVILAACSAWTVARALRRPAAKEFVRREAFARVLQVLVPAAAMLIATPFLGIYVASAVYMTLYMRLAGRFSWIASLLLPLAFTVTVFLVFERWFLVPLPKGPLEVWLGY